MSNPMLDEFNKRHGTNYKYVLDVPIEMEGAQELYDDALKKLRQFSEAAYEATHRTESLATTLAARP